MKKKLSLKDLKVSSFTTSLETEISETVKGGIPAPIHSWKWCKTPLCTQYYACESQVYVCETVIIQECGSGVTEPPVC